MSGPTVEDYFVRELKYQVRRRVAQECRKGCHDEDSMVKGITVMLGVVLTMAAFSAMLSKGRSGRGR